MEPLRILVVDDEPSFTRMLKMSLERRGFKVMTENTGAFAYKVALDFEPDFIFLDVIMPDVDGGDIAAKLRGNPKFKDTPIVFLTAAISRETTRVKGNIVGGQTYLAKPTTVNEVLKCIETAMKKRGVVGAAPQPNRES